MNFGDDDMAYTAIDLLDKVIYAGEKSKGMYDKSLERLQKNSTSYLVIKVISKNLGKNIEHYEKLKEEICITDLEEIDFVIYDKISSLINEFTNKIIFIDTIDIKSSIEVSLNFQKDVLALFISIQGWLIKSEKDIKTKTYEILGDMIKQKKKSIGKLEEFVKEHSQKSF